MQRKGLKQFAFVDDTFGVNRTYLHSLCRSLSENCPGIKWNCTTRADLLDEESVKLMKEAGCATIEIGLESGSNRILQEIRKGSTVEQAITAARIVKKHGIVVRTNVLLGLPMETEQTLNGTIRVIGKIEGRLNYSIFTPYPGSEAYDYCKEAGLIRDGYQAYLFNHQSPENRFFANISKEQFRATAEMIEKYVDKRNANEDLKQFFSYSTVEKVLNFGVFRSTKSLKSFARGMITEVRYILKGFTSQ